MKISFVLARLIPECSGLGFEWCWTLKYWKTSEPWSIFSQINNGNHNNNDNDHVASDVDDDDDDVDDDVDDDDWWW